MIKSFRHKGIKAFFDTGTKKGIQTSHATRLNLQLTVLNVAISETDMNVPSWDLHPIVGKNPKGQSVEGHWSVKVNGNWRLTFFFEDGDAVLVDYMDYH